MSPGSMIRATGPTMSGVPTRCVLLKNMFDPANETGENWDQEIAADVSEECSKYGKVVHCFVDKYSEGHVYLKFDSIVSSSAAGKAINGRFFAGKQIAAEYITVDAYNVKFPESASM